MRADLPSLKWAPELKERVELVSGKTKPQGTIRKFAKPGGSFDANKALKQLKEKRNAPPPQGELPDEAVRFWFFACTRTAVALEDAIEEALKHDLKKAPTKKQVETWFRDLCAAGRWDIPQPQSLIPLMPRLVSWDDTIRLIVEHPRAWAVNGMLAVLPTPKMCGASKKDTERGKQRLIAFIDSRDDAGSSEIGQALQLVHYPDGVARFFKDCNKRYTKRIASQLGGDLLVQLPTAKEAYKAAKKFKISMPTWRVQELVEHFGYENADLLVEACAKDHTELKRIMGLRAPQAVPGWLGLLKKTALVDFAEHWLLNEGAHAIEGMIKTVARRGQKRDAALELLNRVVAAGHGELVKELASDETKKIKELIESHVLAEKEEDTPELPEEDWPKWMAKLVKSAPSLPIEAKKILPSQLPVVRTADGAYRIPTKVLEALIAKVAVTSSTAPAPIKHAAVDFHPEDGGPFAWLLFDRWFKSSKRPDMKQSWVVTLVEHLGGDREAALLGATLTSSKWSRSRQKAMGALRRMKTPEALTALLRVRHRQSKARKLLEEVQNEWSCSWDEFADRIVPDCGLNDLHCLELDFGKRKPIAAVLPPSRLVIVDREAGDVFQKLPPKRKVDDADLYGVARGKYQALRKSLKQVSEEQIPRLERAMIDDRRFTKDHWRDHLSLHPVLGPIVCTLVWKTKRDDRWVLFMPTHPDDTCIDVHYDEVQLGEEIALAHPADMTDAEKKAWAGLIADSEIVQPFDQLARLAFRAGDPDVQREIQQLSAMKRTGNELLSFMHQRGWRGVNKDGKYPTFISGSGEWTAVATIDPPCPNWNWPPSGEHRITGFHFEKKNKKVDEEKVPPVVYSERIRSLFL